MILPTKEEMEQLESVGISTDLLEAELMNAFIQEMKERLKLIREGSEE